MSRHRSRQRRIASFVAIKDMLFSVQTRPRASAALFTATLAITSALATNAWADGKLMIGGGNSLADDVLVRFIDMAGGPGSKICVFGTNSSDPVGSRQSYVEDFTDLGAMALEIDVTMQNSAWNTEPFADGGFTFSNPDAEVRETATRRSQDPETAALVASCDGVWFGGGNQSRSTFSLLNQDGTDTAVATAIREVIAGGGAFGGNSAGAAMQSNPIIVNGTSMDSFSVPPGDRRVGTNHGMEFMPAGTLVDSHFLRRGRIGRLLVAMADNGIARGVGVDESTALIVDLDTNQWEVMGDSQVLIVNLVDANDVGRAIVHLLGHGDRYDASSETVQFNSALTDITGNPYYLPRTIHELGVFDDSVAATLMTRLVDTQEQTTAVGMHFAGSIAEEFGTFGVRLRFDLADDTRVHFCLRSCREVLAERSGSNARYGISHLPLTVKQMGIVAATVDEPLDTLPALLHFLQRLWQQVVSLLSL